MSLKKFRYAPYIVVTAVLFFIFTTDIDSSTVNLSDVSVPAEIIDENSNVYNKNPTSNKLETITIEQIFDGMSPEIDDEVWSLIVTGDVMLGRTVNYKTITYDDYAWAFRKVADTLNQADITFINLENPLVKNCPIKNDGMIFCSSTRHIEGLLHAGIDVVGISNNHTMNYGISGLNDTLEVLKQNELVSVGVENPAYKSLHNIKIAFLAYNEIECIYGGIACIEKETIQNDIETARDSGAELIVVMYHWGTEYTHQPSQRQIDLAHYTIDSGADLVLGNHPHWYQPVEVYDGKVIMYSHGNLIFDQMWSEKTREGVIGKYFFSGNRLIDVEFIPTYIHDYGQPQILSDNRGNEIIKNLKNISLQLAN